MTVVREVMTAGAECAQIRETLVEAARKMRELNVGSLPICGEDDRLKGMVTDRDIVVKVVADGKDPSSVTVGELAQGEVVWIGADAPVEDALRTMAKRQIRRLPVIEDHRLVGMLSQADVARSMPDAPIGDLVEAISQP